MTDYTQLMLAQLAPQFAAQNRTRDPYAGRRAFGMGVLQQGMSNKPVSGAVEGLARALQAGLGGYLLHRTDEDQDTEERGNASALAAALQAKDKDGQPDIAGITAALARNPKHAGLAAMLQVGSLMQNRQQQQSRDTTRMVTGGGAPPLTGAPGPSVSGAPPGSYEARVSATESPNGATNPQSGAMGFFQFMPDTVVGLAQQTEWGKGAIPPAQLFEMVKADPGKQRELMALYTRQSDAALTQAGIPANDVTRFALHAFGPAGGVSLLKAPDNMPVAQWVQSVNWGRATPQQVIAQNGLEKYQTVGQLKQDFIARRIGGNQPQVTQGQPPTPVAQPPQVAQPPAMPDPGVMPQGAGGDPPGGPAFAQPGSMAPGFGAAPTVKLPPTARMDDGSREMAIYDRWVEMGAPAAQEKVALQYYETAQKKRLAAQQAQADAANKEPPMMARTGQGGVGMVEGALEAIRAQETAKAQGKGVMGPPQLVGGAVGQSNTVTGKFDALPAGDKIRAFDQSARDVYGAADRFMEEFKAQGGAGINTLFNNPRDPKAQRLLAAYNNMIMSLRGEAFANTGVLQPAEIAMLRDQMLAPDSIRGATASVEAMQAKIDELKQFIDLKRTNAYGSAGVEAPPLVDKPRGGPAAGAVEDGYRFKGGDPAKQENWEKVQ